MLSQVKATQTESLEAMGVKHLSKKLRDAKYTPDVFSKSKKLHGKTIGIDLSAVLHKSVGTDEGAGYFFVQPTCRNNEVVDKCTRLCGWAKSNEITLKISVDGKYHPMKERENDKRKGD